eukprot:3619990-Rhodomonas_salina.2
MARLDGPPSRLEEEGETQYGGASGGSGALLECVVQLLAARGGVMKSGEFCQELYKERPGVGWRGFGGAKDEIQSAGGLKAYDAQREAAVCG